MRTCPNCGQGVAEDADRFCPNCGAALAPAGAGSQPGRPVATTPPAQPAYQPSGQSSQPAYQSSGQPSQPAYQSPPQPAYQPPAQGTYRPPVYAAPAPDPTAYQAPSYTSGGVQGANLPAPAVQRVPTPVAPARGADPAMNTLMGMTRSVVAMDLRGLLILAALVVVVIVALVVVFKVVSWLFSILPLLILLAAIFFGVRWYTRRGRRLP